GSRRHWRLWTGALFLFALVLTCWPVSTTFDASVETESLSVTSEAGHAGPRWYLKSANVSEDGGRPQPFEGAFEPAERSTILFERIGHGPLLIQCSGTDSDGSSGSLFDSQEQLLRRAGSRIVFRLDNFRKRSES